MRAWILLFLVLTAAAATAAGPLRCSRDLAGGGSGLERKVPTDVGVDADGLLYVLYGQEGRLDVMRSDGTTLQARGEEGGERPPARMAPHSLYVGPDGPPTLLAAEAGQPAPEWVLAVRNGRLRSLRLKGAPSLESPAAVAPGPEGRIYVLCGSALNAFGASGGFQYRNFLPGVRAPRAVALDAQRNVFVIDGQGLKVFSPKGEERYSVPGARAFYLSPDRRMVVAGGEWVRKYSTDGKLLVENDRVPGASGRQATAVSVAADGAMFVYYRDLSSGGGLVVRLDARGDYLEEFLQPARFPPSPDPGYRLGGDGRLYFWDAGRAELVKAHPGGRVELQAGFAPAADAKGHLQRPTDLAVDSGGTVWIADAGNFRIQRFDRWNGWRNPIATGIRGGPARAEPRQVALDGQGALLSVVYPPAGQGQVVLQRRDRGGRLLFQQDLGAATADAVVKLAVGADGNVFLYRSAGLDNPTLVKLDARGRTLARVGGEDRNFHLPGQPLSRLTLKPEEDLVPWRGGLILPTNGRLVFVDSHLKVTSVRDVLHKRGLGLISPDFGGGAVSRGTMLYLADLSNACVHRIPLP